jgi:hypothetical protein
MGLLDVLLDRTFLVSNIITTDVFSILLQTELEIMLDGYYKLTPTEARDHLISESKRVFPEKKLDVYQHVQLHQKTMIDPP